MIQTFKSYMLNKLELAVEFYILQTNSYIHVFENIEMPLNFLFLYCFIYLKQDKLKTFNLFTYNCGRRSKHHKGYYRELIIFLK
jgi:hypothetical protein